MQFFAVTVFDRWYGQISSFRHGDGGDIQLSSYADTQLRTCNGAEYQVKIFLSMPIYAFHGAILGVFLLGVTLCIVI